MDENRTEYQLTVETVPSGLHGWVRKGLFAFNCPPYLDTPDERLETVLSYASRPIAFGHDSEHVVHLRDAAYTCLEGFPLQFTHSARCTWDPTGPVLTLERRPSSGREPEKPSVRWTPSGGLLPWSGEPAPTGQPVPFPGAQRDWERIVPSGIPGLCWCSRFHGPEASVLELVTWPGRQALARLDLSPWAPEPRSLPVVAFPLVDTRCLLLYWHTGGGFFSPPRVRDQPRLCFLVRARRRVAGS